MARTLYVVRHAMTAWNAERRWQGQTDIPLSDEGRAQASSLVDRLRGLGLVSVHTSDLSRARETAEIVARALGLPVVSDRDLRDLERHVDMAAFVLAVILALLAGFAMRAAAINRPLR